MVEEISAQDLEQRLDEDDVTVVDVRESVEFLTGHIPGAINVPMGDIPHALAEYDWTTDVVVVCPVGQLSLQAARLLSAYEGVPDDATVASLAGGYADWPYELTTPSLDSLQ